MQRAEFNAMAHHANMYVEYEGDLYYVIATNFPEALFALVPSKGEFPADEWMWARCESVSLRKPAKVIAFK